MMMSPPSRRTVHSLVFGAVFLLLILLHQGMQNLNRPALSLCTDSLQPGRVP